MKNTVEKIFIILVSVVMWSFAAYNLAHLFTDGTVYGGPRGLRTYFSYDEGGPLFIGTVAIYVVCFFMFGFGIVMYSIALYRDLFRD
jgi:hypothetical protein